MDILGNLTAGVGVATDFQQNYAHQFLIIGDSFTAPDLNGINVTVGGDVKQRINIAANTVIMEVFSQLVAREVLGLDPAGAELGFIIPIGDGFNKEDKILYTIINGSLAGTPQVRAYSKKKGDRKYVRSGMEQINPNSSQFYDNFDYLVFDPTSFDYADITFWDGHQEGRMDLTAMQSLLGLDGPFPNQVSAGNAVLIDNTNREIVGITINATGNPAGLNVINISLPS